MLQFAWNFHLDLIDCLFLEKAKARFNVVFVFFLSQGGENAVNDMVQSWVWILVSCACQKGLFGTL